MRNRQASSSDDEDEVPLDENRRKGKMLSLEDEEESELEEGELREYNKQDIKKKEEPETEDESEDEEDAECEDENPEELMAQPIGDVVRVSGKGECRRNHYDSFEYDGNIYNLEDPVLLVPLETHLKPRVAILKDITQPQDGAMMVTGQWFYRPEDAKKGGGGNWQARTTREIFYSFDRYEESAECVLHKCIVHFIPSNKQIPNQKQYPGFIVQNVYDSEQKMLFKLTDGEYQDGKQREIDLLVQKTISHLGDLPDLEPGENTVDDLRTKKFLLSSRNKLPFDVSRADGEICRSHQYDKAETSGITAASIEEYYAILSQHGALTEEPRRNRWLGMLLQAIEFMCIPMDNKKNNGKEKSGADDNSIINKISGSNCVNRSHDKSPNSDMSSDWPDAAVNAIAALEKAAYDRLSSDMQKYKQKMRHLKFNLKNNAVLARRLLSGELEPYHMLNMSSNELKMTGAGEVRGNNRISRMAYSLLRYFVLYSFVFTITQVLKESTQMTGVSL